MQNYSVIFSDPDDVEWGTFAQVAAISYGDAVAQCDSASLETDGLFEGCDFTVWPLPAQPVQR